MRAGWPEHSFPAQCRLASSKEFHRVYREGRRGRVGPFAWHARANACEYPRLGLAVPKRVIKKATDRSRLKRLVRESFRRNRSKLASLDVVVTVKTEPGNLYDPVLNELIDSIWDKIIRGRGAAS